MPARTTPTIDVERTLGDLVAERPARAWVLERAGIDYCCHGHRTLGEAASAAGLDVATVAAALAAVTDPTGAEVDRLDPVALVDHIVDTHHAYLHEELSLLDALATKVRDVHGQRHAELVDVARLVHELRTDLEPHLALEETVLFPAIRAAGDGAGGFAPGTADPVRALMAEHDQAGALLAELRTLAEDYLVPDDGCASYTSLYARFAHLEADTHRHIHLENNVLFPAVIGGA